MLHYYINHYIVLLLSVINELRICNRKILKLMVQA